MDYSEMRVLIQLTGEELDLNDLHQVLKTDKWRVIKNDDGYYLCSPVLDAITDNNEILAKAQQFLDVANGAANIFFRNHIPVKIGA